MSTEDEQRELYGLRLKIGEQINALRARYGNKDGRAKDGAIRRYDDPLWTIVEAALNEANSQIFLAEEYMRMEDKRRAKKD